MLSGHAAPTKWVKSSYSAVNGDCVEVRRPDLSAVAIRDSKNPCGPMLAVAAPTWSEFVLAVRRDDSAVS
ncbi:DUF397 domain-containing protein [Streptomyces zhihengii]|uniref:DUF397 domain-containing protein n=1 Tax=Streptomyces zhihengii TaxID=1818004 RepID=UPI0033B0DF2B